MKFRQTYKIFVLVIYVFVCFSQASKLNVPRVLLPLFHDFKTNFTLEVKDSGCYRWTTLRPNIINLKQQYSDPVLGCSSEVVVSAITREFHRNSETVLAEEVHTGQVFRCEVILDVISTLNIVTTTRELFLEESPEAFEVRAYDDQGNEFSTLKGVEFTWKLQSTAAPYKSCNVIRYITFEDSPYETPPSVARFDKSGLRGHIILLEGTQTGAATVTVSLPYKEYKSVPETTVQLMVLTNLIISPSEVVLLEGDSVNYKLYQVQHGKVNEIKWPSGQYYLQSENPKCLSIDEKTGVATALSLCKTKVILVDKNVVSNVEDLKPPTAVAIVTIPDHISLVVLPGRKWSITLGNVYDIIVEIYDGDNRKFHIGDKVEVKTHIDPLYLDVEYTSLNGTYHRGTPIKQGESKVSATLLGVVDKHGTLRKTDRLNAVGVLKIYDKIQVTPDYVLLPFDPVYKCKYDIPLTVTGGDSSFVWSSSNNTLALVTQTGVVKTQDEGTVVITAAMTRNSFCSGTSTFCSLPPERLEIVEYTSEADVGTPITLYIALYVTVDGVEYPFTTCNALPFDIEVHEDNFIVSDEVSPMKIGRECGSVTVIGKSPGTSLVTVSYRGLKDSIILAAHRPLTVRSPESSLLILAVGSSRQVFFTGGPRAWANRPSEHSHTIYTSDGDGEVKVEEICDDSTSQQRDVYKYYVLCEKLGEMNITLHVVNKLPSVNSNHTESTATVHVICAKPRYLLLSPVIQVTNASKCPMNLNSERIMAQNYRDVEIEVTVTDIQGRKFDNFTSLCVDWHLSHPSLAQIIEPETIKTKVIEEDGLLLPGRFYQIVRPHGRTGVVDVRGSIKQYNNELLYSLDIVPERPPFPQLNTLGQMVTPDIKSALSIILVNDTVVTPNTIELYNSEGTGCVLQVSQGSGFYDFALSVPDVIDMKYTEDNRQIVLSPLKVGRTSLTLIDLCLESQPTVANVRTFSVGAIKVDIAERVERGKSITAIVTLYDEENAKLTSVLDKNTVSLRAISETNIIKVKRYQEQSDEPGTVKYLVSGVQLGDTYLKFAVGSGEEEVQSRSSPVQVFPQLRISPRSVDILVGANFQVETFDGPAEGSIEFTTNDVNVAKVSNSGIIEGSKIGRTVLTARSVSSNKDTGKKLIDSEDTVDINVIPLQGISVHAPLTRIVQGGMMPLWAVGRPDIIDSMILGSTKYDLTFKWQCSQSKTGEVSNVFDSMGLSIPDSDKVTMQFKALQAGRVTITLTVAVPKQLSGKLTSTTYTDSLQVEVYPSLSLTRPRQQPLWSLLLSTHATTQLFTTRDTISQGRIQYSVQLVLDHTSTTDNAPCVVSVSDKGSLQSFDTNGRALVNLMITEDFGVRTHHSIVVEVKPVHYIMLNIAPKLKTKKTEVVSCLPNGLDVEFQISYHDNTGAKFDAVQSSVMIESNAKDCLHFHRGETNSSIVASVRQSGTAMLRIWDSICPHRPTDYVKIQVGDVIFPSSRRVTVGDVICFRMPLTSGEDQTTAWSVDDPDVVNLSRDIGVGCACGKPGTATVKYQAKQSLHTKLQVQPISSMKFLPQARTISNLADTEVPLVLANSEDVDKVNNMLSLNGTCNTGSDNYQPRCYPFKCNIDFNTPVVTVDIKSVFTVKPYFNIKTGLYSCRIHPVTGPNKRTSSLTENIRIQAATNDEKILSEPIIVPFTPGLFIQQSELRVSQIKQSTVLQITGSPDVLRQVEVLPEYTHLVSVHTDEDSTSYRSYTVDVDSSWWTVEDPPSLSVLIWSKIPDQQVKIPIRCTGHRMAALDDESAGGPVQWIIGLLVLVSTVLVLYSQFLRPSRPPGGQYQSEAYFAPPSPPSRGESPSSTPSHTPYIRPFGESPVYGSPQRFRDRSAKNMYT